MVFLVILLVSVFSCSFFKKHFGKFTNLRKFRTSSEFFRKQPLSKSCLEGPHSRTNLKATPVMDYTYKHFKPTVTRQLISSRDYCSLSIAIASNTTVAIWLTMFL